MLYLKKEIVEDMTLAVHGRIKASGHNSYPVSGRIPDIMTASYAVSKWPKTRNFLLLESTKIQLLITVKKKFVYCSYRFSNIIKEIMLI